jgi:YgiT-type zinc finger domain-containing protein
MTGRLEKASGCPTCGGRLVKQTATIPFTFENTIVVVKNVPAEVCSSCHEPYVDGVVTDRLTPLLTQLRELHTEVSVVSYEETRSAAVAGTPR